MAWWVVCPEFSSGPLPRRADAERRLEHIVKFAMCLEEHSIVESDEEPIPAWRPEDE